MPSIADTPNREMNPTAADTLAFKPKSIEPEDSAADREWNAGQRQQTVAHGIEQAVEQHHDQHQAERHDDGEPLLGFDQGAELT